MRRTQILLAALIGLTALLFVGGCTQEQIDRAAQISAAADARLVQADQALELAQRAVEQGKVLAEQIGSVRAQQVIGQAEQALAAAGAAREVAKVAADGAHGALDAAKAAQAAGGSTIDVIIAIATTTAPALGGLLMALRKLWAVGRDFRQTVAGVEKAKETLPADAVAKLHAALAETQDAGAKQRVAVVKAALAGLLLCVLPFAPAAASDIGLGPVPTNTTLTAPGPIGSTTPAAGSFTTLSASGAFTHTGTTFGIFGTTPTTQQLAGMNADRVCEALGLRATGGHTSRRNWTAKYTGVSLNSANTDVATITGLPSRWRAGTFFVFDPSQSLSSCSAQLMTGAGGTGSNVFSASPASFTSAVNATDVVAPGLVGTTVFTATTLYFRNIAAQGSATTCSIVFEYIDLSY